VGNQLSLDEYREIAFLCQEHAVAENVAIVEADETEQMQEEKEEVAAADDLEQDVEVPVLLNEEEVAIKEEPHNPYQLTRYYQNELVQFQEAFEERMNEQYEHERTIFEHQQQQLYNVTLVLEGEQLQQPQQQINNLPGAALVDDLDNLEDDNVIVLEGNNNIIIDDNDDSSISDEEEYNNNNNYINVDENDEEYNNNNIILNVP
jgi:hypothetical protein